MQIRPPAGFRGAFRADDDARAVYSEAAGIGRILPVAVAVPDDANDVAALLEWGLTNAVAIIPRGSGSSMSGGAIGDGVVMDLSRMRRIGDPDVEGRRIRAETGVLRGEVQRLAASVNLRFAVDPSSGEFCTIGGMAATNAAGPHSLRYGSMRPWVLALDCVFADGSRGTIRRGSPAPQEIAPVHRFVRDVQPALLGSGRPSHPDVCKDSSGYGLAAYAQSHELVDLLVGSEGTLAVFTAVEVALIPAAGASASLFVSFPSLDRAVEAAVASREAGVAACELLDRTFLTIAAEAGQPLPASPASEAVLLVEVEASDHAAAILEAERLRKVYLTLGADQALIAQGSSRESELWAFRHAASPAIARLNPALRSMQFIEDAAVPPRALAEYVRGVRAILVRNDTVGVIFGHAGDAHVHVNPLIDVSRVDWRERVDRILADVTALVARLDGTITGEHGDGRLRTPLLDQVWRTDELERFALLKRAFDPQNVLNPGVKISVPGQRALDLVKYDPRLSVHPNRAASALATVERERGYARYRLDLL